MKKSVLIIGAGPAGLVAAGNLLNNGIAVTIVEKSTFPRVVVGESLLPISLEHFEKIGVFDALNEKNYQIKNGARFVKEGVVCEFDFSKAYTKDSKTWTWQVPRADFDAVIAKEIESKGAEIMFNSTIDKIEFNEKVDVQIINNGNTINRSFDYAIDASGLGCVLPNLLNLQVNKSKLKTQAIFTHVKDTNKNLSTLPKHDFITFEIVHQDLWFWVIPFSDGTTSIGVVGNEKHFPNEDSNEDTLSTLRNFISESKLNQERFEGFEPLFPPLHHKGFSQYCETFYGDQFVLIGNSFEFIDPVFSSGVAMATSSAIYATDNIIQSFSKNESPDWTAYEQFIKNGIKVYRDFVTSWYDGRLQTIFFADTENVKFKEQICSVLAGYVWDETNPFVKKADRSLTALAKVIELK